MDMPLKTLLILSLGGTLLGLSLMLLRRLLGKKLPSAFYYYAWLLVFLRFLLPLPGLVGGESAVVESPLALDTAAPPAIESLSPRSYLSAGADPAGEPSASAAPASDNTAAPAAQPVTEQEEAASSRSPEPTGHTGPELSSLLHAQHFWLGLWLCGAILCLTWYIWGYVRYSRAVRRCLKDPSDPELAFYLSIPQKHRPELAKCPGLDSPMLLGVARPLLVLPDREYSPERLSAILSHELTHYRRGDLIFKWFAVLVFSLHWFNPFTRLFRRELDRACELSCDEHLLRRMDRDGRQNYGETLLDLAAGRSLSPRVIATSFATEKRNLKERLEQIMTYKKKGRAALALTLAAILLLCGCGAALGPAASETIPPAPTPETSQSSAEPISNPASQGEVVSVGAVDALLSAIAPGAEITLKEGVYDLTMASNYGHDSGSDYYRWESMSDGFELVITGVDGLSIKGAGMGDTVVCAQSRQADVLRLEDCENIRLSGFSAGHTEKPVPCSGEVLTLENCSGIQLEDCGLYGCGTVGLNAENSAGITLSGSDIYDCSDMAMFLKSCADIRLENCNIYACGSDTGPLFFVWGCRGFALVNSRVYDNNCMSLIYNNYSPEVYLLGSTVENNRFSSYLFNMSQRGVIVDKCSFANDGYTELCFTYGDMAQLLDIDGNVLDEEQLLSMKRENAVYNGPGDLSPLPAPEGTINADGLLEVHVQDVDSFLAAIGPDTIIYLDGEIFDLSTARSYGQYSTEYYDWINYDGPGLRIKNVKNLTIIGQGKDKTQLCAVPRTVDVLSFENCENLTLSSLTAGHTPEPGACSGGVLAYSGCKNMSVEDCGLFGCGIIGIGAESCEDMAIKNTDIYECSSGAARFYDCTDVVFTGCTVRDCGTPEFVCDLSQVSYNGTELPQGNSQVS